MLCEHERARIWHSRPASLQREVNELFDQFDRGWRPCPSATRPLIPIGSKFPACTFERSLRLPEGISLEKIGVSMNNGVLMVFMPKGAAAQKQTKRIDGDDQAARAREQEYTPPLPRASRHQRPLKFFVRCEGHSLPFTLALSPTAHAAHTAPSNQLISLDCRSHPSWAPRKTDARQAVVSLPCNSY